jgi:hypothetical protein
MTEKTKPVAKKEEAKPVVEAKPVAAPAGEQAPLELINLISSGMSMKEAKAKLGIE